MMPRAADSPPVGTTAVASFSMPGRMMSIRRGTPMRPVEQTRKVSGATPNCWAAWTAMAWASRRPCLPVQALAWPLLTTMPWATPILATRSASSRTVAALTWLVVKVPARTAGTSEKKRAMSGLRLFLSPATMPAARNPAGSVAAAENFKWDFFMMGLSRGRSIGVWESGSIVETAGETGGRKNPGTPRRPGSCKAGTT